jgi:hypothetical protein
MRLSFLGFASGVAAALIGVIGALLLHGGWEAAAAGLAMSGGMQAAICVAVMVAIGDGAGTPRRVVEPERRVPRAKPVASPPRAQAAPVPAARRRAPAPQRPVFGS